MAWTSKTTEEFKNGNGSNLDFTFSFEYLQQDDVKVQVLESNVWVDKAVTTDWTFHNATTIRFNSGKAPANLNRNVRIYRDTEIDAAKAIYAAGSSVRAKDLNDNQDQLLYALQEEQFNVIIHDRIDQGAITNTNVSPIAEIEVSKLKDGTARQLLQTDTAGTGVEWTSNVDVPGTLDVTGAVDFDSTLTVDGTSTLTGNVTVGGTVDGRDIAADGTKLDTIETGATADQTAAEIRTLVGNATDSQVFTDADHTKLDGIETGATADQTNAEIRTAVEAATDSNVFTDADHTKLDGIAAGAEVNVQSDWNASSGDAQILNKPSVPTNLADLANVHTASPTDGQVLKWINSNSRWEPAADATGAGGAALTDGDKGDITVSGTGAVWTIDNDTIGLDELSASGTPSNSKFLRGDNTWADAGSSLTIKDEGTDKTTAATSIDFVGAGVTATNSGAAVTVTVSGGGGNTSTDFKYLELRNAANNGAASYPASDFTLVTSGTTTALTPAQANALIVSYGGVIQQPNTGTGTPTTGFAIDGSTIKFGSAIAAAPDFIIYLQGAGVASIADNTVTGAKIALGSDAAGDIMYYNGTDYVRLAKGTDGHYLKQGSSNAPEWAAVSQPDSDKIEEGNSSVEVVDSGTGKVVINVDGNDVVQSNPIRTWLKGANIGENWGQDGTTGTGIQVLTSNNHDLISSTSTQGLSLDSDVIVKLGRATASGGSPDDLYAAFDSDDIRFYITDNVRIHIDSTEVKTYVNFVPDTDSSLDLGTNTVRFQNAYVDTYYGDGSNLTGIASTTADGCIYENDQTISNNYTIAAGKGAHSVGPITVNATVTVNGNWVVS